MIDLKAKTPQRVEFEKALRKYVVGQNDAVEIVARAYERISAGLVDENKPLCTMLFLGPTGVGKTLLVDAVAEAIHGNREHKLVINCAEFSEDHSIARIIGAPPGYIGHDTTEPVINPVSMTRGWVDKGPKITVLLFDEVEKAAPKLHQLMLEVTGKGELTNARNQTLNMSRCMIFMTSNVGSHAINQDHVGFRRISASDNFKEISAAAISAARKAFDPEFLGRVTDTITFRNLSDSEVEDVLDKELWYVYERALMVMLMHPAYGGARKNIFRIATTPRLRKFMTEARTDKEKGARSLTGIVREKIEIPLATIIATHQVTLPGIVVFDIVDGEITAEFTNDPGDSRVVVAGVEKLKQDPPTGLTPELLRQRLGPDTEVTDVVAMRKMFLADLSKITED